jgi:hypothetical protein
MSVVQNHEENEMIRSIHSLMENKYGLKKLEKMRNCSIQEMTANERAEIGVDTKIKTDIKVQNNRLDLFILDKKSNEITMVEMGITKQDQLQKVEVEKHKMYYLLAKELWLLHGCKMRIIPHVMT